MIKFLKDKFLKKKGAEDKNETATEEKNTHDSLGKSIKKSDEKSGEKHGLKEGSKSILKKPAKKPVTEKKPPEFFKVMARFFPKLKDKLLKANMPDTPEHFLQKVFMLSLFGGLVFTFAFLNPILGFFGVGFIVSVILFPIISLLLFSYIMKLPDLYAIKLEKDVTRELIFALRFLIIELESGVMVYHAFVNIRRNYPTIGRYFGEVVDQVDYGTNMEEAINKVVNKCPSDNLKMVLVQVQITMKTGADLVSALNTAADQFTREQKISVDEYSKKLNPIAMFYMIVAVIFPSIGFMMLIIISSFLGFQIDVTLLLVFTGILGFAQFMFISVIRSMRPPVDF